MKYDWEAAEEQRASLVAIAEIACTVAKVPVNKFVKAALSEFAEITPPVEPPVVMECITVFSSGRGGVSRKPGNICLSWRKLFDVVPDVAIAGAGATAAPVWLGALIGLYVWNKVSRGAEEFLSDEEATTIHALWRHRDANNTISEDDGWQRTNDLRKSAGLTDLCKRDYNKVIDRLLNIRCIKMFDAKVHLCETVRVRY